MKGTNLTECPASGTPYLFLDSTKEKARYIIKARCKLWKCPYCAYVNKHQHYVRILNGCNRLYDKRHVLNFVTITSHEKLKTTAQCLFVWRSGWQKFKERLRRNAKNTTGNPLSFVCITEFHKDGRLHWHGIINGNISNTWFKNSARACGLGYMCKSELLDNAIQGTNYCIKYISKFCEDKEFPKKMHRISYSQSFPPKPDAPKTGDWEVLSAKKSLVDCIEEGWKKDYDTYLSGNEIKEIISPYDS